MKNVIRYRANDTDREYKIMSYNILCDFIEERGIKRPEERRDLVVARIMEQMPDTLGAQECTEFWFDSLCADLGEFYEGVGELSGDSRHRWRNPIFYRKDKFDLVETRTRWLSETPDVQSKVPAPTEELKRAIHRTMTHVVLRDKENGNIIVHCNTHMGFHPYEREIQNSAFIKMLDEFEYPVLTTGDYNMTVSYPQYAQIEDAGYISAHELTEDHDERGSFLDSPNMIDFCFVNPNAVNVISHKIVDSKGASDHHAVVVRFKLN